MADIPHRWIQRSTSKNDLQINAVAEVIAMLFSRLLAVRGLKTEEEIEAFLNPSLSDLHDPFLMPGMK